MVQSNRLRDELVAFLRELEAHLGPDQKVELYLGGGAGILLAYDGEIATEDVDFIGEKAGLLLELSELAGKGSEIHRRTNYYMDTVPPGTFPQDWGWRERAVAVVVPELQRISLWVLEIHDLIISKLRRFEDKDREDIRRLCSRPELEVETLRARYRHARLLRDYDERERLDNNFNTVEVEFLGRDATEFS